eukprot:3838908-Rhodomonas_salina.1
MLARSLSGFAALFGEHVSEQERKGVSKGEKGFEKGEFEKGGFKRGFEKGALHVQAERDRSLRLYTQDDIRKFVKIQ